MAYQVDPNDGSIVISGFGDGIAQSPYDGISDMRNVNIISIPGEASVNFSTQSVTSPIITGATVSSSNAAANTITFTGATGLEKGMAIYFTAQSGIGVSLNVTYWIATISGGNTCQLYTDFNQTAVFDVTGNGTGTFSAYSVGIRADGLGVGSSATGPKYFAFAPVDNDYYMLDGVGQLWTNQTTTASGYWEFAGISGTAATNEAGGLVYYQSTDLNKRFIFVFRNQTIDYFSLTSNAWVFGWTPSDGTGSHATATLTTSTLFHAALLGQDNVLYICDGSSLTSLFEKDGQQFDPTNTATYTFTLLALSLPSVEKAQCLAELGVNLLVGGIRNQIYPWDRVSTSFKYPILIAEYNIQKMVTVNTNTYIFPGNRGRIYITNGSQGNLYKKIPDHISATVEPYYTWGDAIGHKNQLYFSFSTTNNAGTALSTYGGVWAVDLDTKALRLTNKLSFGTYLGLAGALVPNFSNVATTGSNPSGTGLFIGWWGGTFTSFGIDQTISNPYTGSQASVDSDLIPIGTFLKRRNFQFIEYKLNQPMVSGESVVLNYRLKFSDSYTQILSDSTVGNFSNFKQMAFANSQWIQIQAVLNSTASTPSYTRLTEIRIR